MIGKVEVFKTKGNFHGDFYKLRVVVPSQIYGNIVLHSDTYRGLREADSRAVTLATILGLERDTLPVHGGG